MTTKRKGKSAAIAPKRPKKTVTSAPPRKNISTPPVVKRPKKSGGASKKPKTKPDDPLLTAAEYAHRKKISRQAVSRMGKRHGIFLDENKKAKLSVWAAADAIGRSQDKNTLAARVAGLPEGGLAAIGAKSKIKKMDLEIEQITLELAKTKGEMISRQDAERQMADTVSLCLTLIDQVADNWAAKVRDHEMYSELTDGIDRARAYIAEALEKE